jgi:hypothetical protein
MRTSRVMAEALWRADVGLRRAYQNLPDEQKAEVEAAFRRHYFACENNGLKPEPRFLHETIQDIREGIHESSIRVKEGVGKMVQTAFAQQGGSGDAGAVIIR